jgi:hypothetical protein
MSPKITENKLEKKGKDYQVIQISMIIILFIIYS